MHFKISVVIMFKEKDSKMENFMRTGNFFNNIYVFCNLFLILFKKHTLVV